MKAHFPKPSGAFTLIELLIVVAIIAILAAIAVPNFLEAQTRSKVSRAKSDMRTIATGIEAYRVDANRLPLSAVDAPLPWTTPDGRLHTIYSILTTPVAYLTTYPLDPFLGDKVAAGDPLDYRRWFDYRRTLLEALSGGGSTLYEFTSPGFAPGAIPTNQGHPDGWILWSPGPDREQNINTGYKSNHFSQPLSGFAFYDPTNGTVSTGDVIRSSYGEAESLISR